MSVNLNFLPVSSSVIKSSELLGAAPGLYLLLGKMSQARLLL